MLQKVHSTSVNERTTLQKIDFVVTKIAPTAIATLFVFYFLNFYDGVKDQGTFGAFGDYFGGILNPILSFLTIVILVYSIRLQARELELTRSELSETKAIHSDNLKLQREILEEQSRQYALKALADKLENHMSKFMETVEEPLLLPPNIAQAKGGTHLSNLLSIVPGSNKYLERLNDSDLDEYMRSVISFTDAISITMNYAVFDLREVLKLGIPATHIPDHLLLRPLSVAQVIERGFCILDEGVNQRQGLNQNIYGEFTRTIHEFRKAKRLLVSEYDEVRKKQFTVYQESTCIR